ncbi:MAG: acyl-CoA dehydrogenase family protein, partial [Methanobacterium paludis]|nr:acyl-CoA dehydrogenase family protein [Methanobacterium paludis]
MDFRPDPSLQAFRQEVREFLRESLPPDLPRRKGGFRSPRADLARWQGILHAKGWGAPYWASEHGGTGWTAVQKYIFAQEMARVGAPEPVPFGMKMVAPVIFTYGNDEQKQRFLPDILASNVWWCQGYSEPNAGSDLASLKTTAVRDGD